MTGSLISRTGESGNIDGTPSEVHSEGNLLALRLINCASDKFGRHWLAAGNCGKFALALSSALKKRGYNPTIGILHRWIDGTDSDRGILNLSGTDPDIYHVVVLLDDALFDACGQTTLEALVAMSIREYRDPSPGFVKDIDPDDADLADLIDGETNWSIAFGAFLECLEKELAEEGVPYPALPGMSGD